MYITTGTSTHYAVTAAGITPGDVRYTLETVPDNLGAAVQLYDGEDNLMREDTVADYAYPRIKDSAVILSNMPEPVESGGSTTTPTTPSTEDDLLETVVDHEVRIANLELGVTN